MLPTLFILLRSSGDPRPLGRLLTFAVFAGQEAPTQRPPGEDADMLLLAQRQNFVFNMPLNKRILWLQRHDALEPVKRTDMQTLHQLPGGEIGDAKVAHLALVDQVGERRKGLFQGSRAIPAVNLIQINILRPQSLEAGFASLDDMFTRSSYIVGLR